VKDAWVPAGMKKYGDLNTTNTLIRDSWDTHPVRSPTRPR
jgi:hypothetical protein